MLQQASGLVRVQRCALAEGHGIGYELGCGGRDPHAAHPGGPSHKVLADGTLRPGLWCDCSGFVAWVCGYDRHHDGHWINTDAEVHDANTPGGLYDKVAPTDLWLGDVVVYGAGPKIGHTGIVTRIPSAGYNVGSRGWWQALRVTHCSPHNWRLYHDAIKETIGTPFFRSDTIFARYRGPALVG